MSKWKQKLAEKLGKADRTNLDAELEQQLKQADALKEQIEKIIKKIESQLPEDKGMTKMETLGQSLADASAKLGSTDISKPMAAFGKTKKQLGEEERKYARKAEQQVLTPMRKFVKETCKSLDSEKKIMNDKRVSMDAAKNKMRTEKSDKKAEENKQKAEDTQKAFDNQVEKVMGLLQQYTQHQEMLRQLIKDLVEIENEFYENCAKIVNACKNQL